MDLLKELKILAMPPWLKVALSSFVIGLVILGLSAGIFGAADAERSEWVNASAHTLGAALPFVIAGAVLVFSTTGPEALRSRTTRVLESAVPDTLARLPHISRLGTADAFVEAWPEGTGFSAAYLVRLKTTDGRTLAQRLRIELNVRKANVSLHIDEEVMRGITKAEDVQAWRAAFTTLFASTLAGAKAEGYEFGGTVFFDQVGRSCIFFLIRRLPDDFLWDAGEQLYFAQDLAMMLGGFLREQPDVFAVSRV